jgi:L-alanine-DL-glutamate epimerase-like enolase superfamily enzyme
VRITGLELFDVPPRWLLLKVSTDEGIAGWGEPIVEGRAATVAVAPHCPLGPVALAARLQLDARTPDAAIQEMSLGVHHNEGGDLLDYVCDPSVFDRHVDGVVAEW